MDQGSCKSRRQISTHRVHIHTYIHSQTQSLQKKVREFSNTLSIISSGNSSPPATVGIGLSCLSVTHSSVIPMHLFKYTQLSLTIFFVGSMTAPLIILASVERADEPNCSLKPPVLLFGCFHHVGHRLQSRFTVLSERCCHAGG